jgi:two-component system response regulator FixJ
MNAMMENPLVHLIEPDDDDCKRVGVQLDELCLEYQPFSDAESFLITLDPNRLGCVLTELKLGCSTALQLVKRLRHQGSCIPVILLTAHATVTLTVEAFKAGLFEVLEKPSDAFKLWDCTTRAFESHGRKMVEAHHRNGIMNRISQLSRQEQQVMQMLLDGQPNKRIAVELGLSPRTIIFRRKSLMQKMNAKSVGELACMVHTVANELPPQFSPVLTTRLDDQLEAGLSAAVGKRLANFGQPPGRASAAR